MSQAVRILIASTDKNSTAFFLELEEQNPRHQIVRLCETISDMNSAIPEVFPDIVLISLDLLHSGNWSLLTELKTFFPTLKIIVFSSDRSPVFLKTALNAGANGFFSAGNDVGELIDLIDLVLHGPPR